MRVLLLCNKSPYPTLEGGPIAMDAMVRGLLDSGAEVCVLAVESNKYPFASLPPDLIEHPRFTFDTAYVDLGLKPWDAFSDLLSGRSYHLSRFRSRAFTSKLEAILNRSDFDIIQFETPFLGLYMPLLRKMSEAPIVLRAHNIEHRVWERLSSKEKNPLKRWYLKKLSGALERFEKEFANECDAIVPITERDADWFRKITMKPVKAFPFGLEHIEGDPPEDLGADLFHIGSMDWMPNSEGVSWFLREVWPLVMSQDAGLRLHLAGRNMPDWLKNTNLDGIVIHGEVPDAAEFMRSYGIMVVPLLSGSGMRIKIIEGMTHGRAIVSTSIGAEGIEYRQGEHLLIADDAGAFATAVLRLTTDEHLRNQLGRNAFRHVRDKYHLEKLVPGLLELYREILAGR